MLAQDNASNLTRNEGLKQSCPTLAGTIAETLADPQAECFTKDDYEFLKFHGIYQGDDRDKRKTGKQYIFMVRCSIPGGVLTPEQYLLCDELARQYANGTLRVTSRQSLQFHHVVKSGLPKLMKEVNQLLTTIAACGDVNRNVMARPTPSQNAITERVQQDALQVALALRPRTHAYHAIWVDGVKLDPDDPKNKDFEDPLYGKTYLPRKFKTGFAVPPLNDVDIFSQDLGFVAIEENGELAGYNLLVGGGMGMSHNNPATYPRMADVLGFITPDQVVAAAKAVVGIHRDFGDRTNRKHARLKYVLAERGADWARAEVERRLGGKLGQARPMRFEHTGDLFGWHRQYDGREFLGLYVPTGRIRDADGWRLMTALREVVSRHRCQVRLTPTQNVILANVDPAARPAITSTLAEHGVNVDAQATPLRRASMACPALPTCGLALAESERLMPALLDRLEALLSEIGLANEGIVVRMTGCPNGCARPYLAEIGLVGRAPGKYNIYLGSDLPNTRLNRLYKEGVKEPELIEVLRPVLSRYATERQPGERFGDWCARVLWKEQAEATALAQA